MIKVMSLSDDFMVMVDDIAMQTDLQESSDPDEIMLNLAAELKKCPKYDQIFARWEASSRMRTYFVEKRKSWANKIKEEEEKKKKEEEKKQKDEADKDKKDDKKDDKNDKKDDKKDEKKDEKKEEKKEEVKALTPNAHDEEEEISTAVGDSLKKQHSTKSKDEIELEKIVDKIIEKAEFIVKLVMPKSWDVENARPILFKANSEGPDRTVALDEDDFMAVAASSGDYMSRLNSFAANQSS